MLCAECGVEVGNVVSLCEECRKRVEQEALVSKPEPEEDTLAEKVRQASNFLELKPLKNGSLADDSEQNQNNIAASRFVRPSVVFGVVAVISLTMLFLLLNPVRIAGREEGVAAGVVRNEMAITSYNVYGFARFDREVTREYVSAVAIWNGDESKLVIGLFAAALSAETVAQIRATRSFKDVAQKEEMTRLKLRLDAQKCDPLAVSAIELEDRKLALRTLSIERGWSSGVELTKLSCAKGQLILKLKMSDPKQGLQSFEVELAANVY